MKLDVTVFTCINAHYQGLPLIFEIRLEARHEF